MNIPEESIRLYQEAKKCTADEFRALIYDLLSRHEEETFASVKQVILTGKVPNPVQPPYTARNSRPVKPAETIEDVRRMTGREIQRLNEQVKRLLERAQTAEGELKKLQRQTYRR